MQHRSALLLAAVLSAMFFVSTAVLAVLYLHAPPEGSLKLEIAKAILQLGVVSVAGAGVSILVFKYKSERQQFEKDREHERALHEKELERDRALDEQRKERHRKHVEYREDLLKGTLARATAGYNSVKKARRLLRARAITVRDSADYVLPDPYDTYMGMINDSQLDFENLKRDVETSKPAFSSPDELFNWLETMEKFLGDMVTEYEELRKDFRGDTPGKKLNEFKELPAFIGPYHKSRFRTEFAERFYRVQQAIRGDLLHPQLADIGETKQ